MSDIGLTGWQEDHGHRPKSIRKRYRFLFPGTNETELQHNDDCIVFVIVHGTGTRGESGRENKDYYDPTTARFQSFMNYASEYVQQHNNMQEKTFRNLHLISFLWNGNLLDTTSRKPAGLELAEYLESWNYRNSKIVCIAHSHGCNVVNFASRRLRNLDKINSDGLYEGRIKELIFFAPPCRQKISSEEKSLFFNLFGVAYDKSNDIMFVTPANYDQLFAFHSPNDHIVDLGSIDALTAIGFAATLGGASDFTVKTIKKLSKNGIPNTAEEQRDLLLGAFVTGGSLYAAWKALGKKLKHSHIYNLRAPQNKENKIKGPKVHIETMVDGNFIEHSSSVLLENFQTVLKILKAQYTLNLARCNDFKINIVTDQIKQDNLLQFIEHVYGQEYRNYKELPDNVQNSQKSSLERLKEADKKNALFTFYENGEDNCKIQCRINKDESRGTISVYDDLSESDYFQQAIQKLQISYGLENRSGLVSNKHQLVYDYYSSELQKNNNDIPSVSCNLL